MNLKQVRKSKGLTVARMAERCGVNAATIEEFESLQAGGDPEELRRLADAYGVTLVEVLIASGFLTRADIDVFLARNAA